MADIREQILGELDIFIKAARAYIFDEISREVFALYTQDFPDQILNLTKTIKGGVCPDCKGSGEIGWKYHGEREQYPPCKCWTCKGTGRLDATKTLEEWAELGMEKVKDE